MSVLGILFGVFFCFGIWLIVSTFAIEGKLNKLRDIVLITLKDGKVTPLFKIVQEAEHQVEKIHTDSKVQGVLNDLINTKDVIKLSEGYKITEKGSDYIHSKKPKHK